MLGPQGALAARLMRDELSACLAYRRALEALGEQPGSGELRRIGREHELAAQELRSHCESGGPAGAGLKGWWASALEGLAQSFGETAAVGALKREESRWLREYERAAQDEAAPAELRSVIEARLLPQTREHLLALDDFLRLQRPPS